MKKFTIEQLAKAMKDEGIGRSSTRYVINKLESLEHTEESLAESLDASFVKMEKKNMPQWYEGVYIKPSSKNNVHFDHNGESLELHFLSNGNLAVSRASAKEHYVEIDKKQLIDLILSKF